MKTITSPSDPPYANDINVIHTFVIDDIKIQSEYDVI